MIAADTSTVAAFLQGEKAADTELLKHAIEDEALVLPPVVIAELFSSPKLPEDAKATLLEIPTIPIEAEFWAKAGEARATLLKAGKKARLADTLIAVSCIQHGIPLIARDGDYRHFAKHFGLDLRPKGK